MASTVESRLNEMGITVPDAPAPAANYVPWVKSGNMIYVAGQVPFVDGKLTATGHLGDNASVEDGYEQWCVWSSSAASSPRPPISRSSRPSSTARRT